MGIVMQRSKKRVSPKAPPTGIFRTSPSTGLSANLIGMVEDDEVDRGDGGGGGGGGAKYYGGGTSKSTHPRQKKLQCSPNLSSTTTTI